MDRSLDETVAERQRSNNHHRDRDPRPPPRRNNYPRDGIRKPTRDDRANLENDWVHDRFVDDDDRNVRADSTRNRNRLRPRRDEYDDSRFSEFADTTSTAKIRVENLHYDITEDELHDLFERIAPVESVKLVYDRAGRSNGTAFIIYPYLADARSAIREFDGANAKGQPIRLELLPPTAPASAGRAEPRTQRDNPFDRVENPRSLFDRVEAPKGRDRRARSASPSEHSRSSPGRRSTNHYHSNSNGARELPSKDHRRSDITKPVPDGIDRYTPSQNSRRSSSHRGGYGSRDSGRRPGERRERGGGDRGSRDGRGGGGSAGGADAQRLVNGRPRKTQEELDAEMDDYWGHAATTANHGAPPPAANGAAGAPAIHLTAVGGDDDIDMIE